ncbi:hypothetical protein [uncultured Nocardioides sp.]|uniref:hypothetical protein n=1 Tax=uncultured Nocardioides sp. TaxID=198441 RepID=UPI00260BD8B2|nr:hypothetical protein [uncultured Nocardioides sp.]
MSTSAHPDSRAVRGLDDRLSLSRAQRTGLVIGGLMSVVSLVPVPTPEGETGPPLAILVLVVALGVIGTVATVAAWRTRSRVWLRVLAGALVVNAVSSLPAFFVPDVPTPLVVFAAAGVVLTLVVVVLLFSGRRR